ncbi:MAG TPA: radical SAM protein, partial [Nitrospiraceae bacterium]|nr:radical SAM protein [Nitrospiraceae bacterium]
GIESGDQNVLDALEKGISVEVASMVLKNLKKAGIATYVYLLFGTPAEDETAARKTLEFTAQHCNSIDFLNLAI